MKVDFDRPILNRAGEQFRGEDGPLTLGGVTVMALDAGALPGETLSVGDKRRYAKLADRVYDGGMVEVTDPEYALIRQRIGKVINSPRVVSQAIDLLEADKSKVEDQDVAEQVATEDA